MQLVHTLKKARTGTALIASLMMGLSVPALASTEDVILKSSDGSINLSGSLVDFTDQFYVLRTTLGDLRISAERVRCEGGGCPVFETAEADVTISGSGAVGVGLMPLLMEGFASHLDADASIVSTNTQGQILANFIGDSGFGDELANYLVSSSSSNDAFTKLLDGSSQLGMASRRIKPQEARDLKKSGAGNMISPNQEHIIAVDGLVLIVHPSNPIRELTVENVKDLYSGKITNWSQLGGNNVPVKFVSRDQDSGARSVFEARLLGDSALNAVNHAVASDNNEVSNLVTSDEGALGYVGFAFQRGAKPLSLINECGISTTPDSFSAKTEEYALQRRMYLYNRTDTTNENIESFVNYVTSEDADDVVRKAGFIDLGIETREQGLDSARAYELMNTKIGGFEDQFATEMLRDMINYDRLSTTFRFRTGSSKLDERGRLDMKRLAAYLETLPKGAEVAMVGFTDDVGAFTANQRLSGKRANAVISQLEEFAPGVSSHVQIAAMGYGEIAPVACNVSDNGRSINRRVEVWVKSKA